MKKMIYEGMGLKLKQLLNLNCIGFKFKLLCTLVLRQIVLEIEPISKDILPFR